MSDQHEPSTCRRILREFREEGLSIHLFNQAQKLREGVYRAEALSGLCGSSEMIEEDRFDWIDIGHPIFDLFCSRSRNGRWIHCSG